MHKCEIKPYRKYNSDRKKIGFYIEETLYNMMLEICGEEDLYMTEYLNLLITRDVAERLMQGKKRL